MCKRDRCLATAFILLGVLTFAQISAAQSVQEKLRDWRQGVWLLGDGSYAIYTATHYFVLMANGDSSAANIYCGASQVVYHDKGMARKQVLRVRQTPGTSLVFFKEEIRASEKEEKPLEIDPSLFSPGRCHVQEGVIYDSVTEVGEDYILLSSCNGDREKIFSNGVAVYLPAGGGEYYSYRIEK